MIRRLLVILGLVCAVALGVPSGAAASENPSCNLPLRPHWCAP
jgi:hypothetical protein